MFKLHKITVLHTEGTDLVFLHTNLPSSMPKVTDQNLIMKFDVEKDRGEAYVQHYLSTIPRTENYQYEVINR